MLNFMSGDDINKEGGATNRDWLMNQMSNTMTFMTVLGNTIGKNNVINGENSTIVSMNKDRTKGTIVDAKADGDKNIYDENGEVVGQTLFDDSFIKYGVEGEIKGPANGNTIYFDVDKTEDINKRVEQADDEFPWTVRKKSKINGDYDVKNVYAKERRTELGNINNEKIDNADYHYDGYMYNGEYFSARSLGNILFGRNIENIPLPNSFMIDMAGRYQAKSNNTKVNKETPEALKSIDYGIKEQRFKNFQDLLKD
ncbi:hypothetical protein HDR59_04655 [bacterium]|nr:hypothetical protein [bacterium]